MGVETAVILALAAAATTAYNTKQTAKKQDRATAESIRKQGELQRDANLKLNETLQFFEESKSGDIREKLSDRYAKALRLQQQQALAGLNTPGATSDAAAQRIGTATSSSLDKAGVLKNLFSRIDAPADQRLLEGFERGDLSSDLQLTRRNSAQEDFLTRLRIAGIQRSPTLDLIAAGLSGGAQGASLGGGAPKTIAGSGTGQSPQTFFNPTSAATLPGLLNLPPGKVTPGSIFGSYGR